MAIKAEKYEKNISASIEKIIAKYSNLLPNLSKHKDSKINKDLWGIRSDLEYLIVEMKHLLKKDLIEERWQKNFLNELKGTGSKTKAIPMLNEYSKTKTSLIAFPTERFSWKNGKLVKENEEIFEI
jgi:hypothetical protein